MSESIENTECPSCGGITVENGKCRNCGAGTSVIPSEVPVAADPIEVEKVNE